MSNVLSSNFSDTTVIIPTLNEEKNIGSLIKKLTALYPKIKVIIADDGSTDNTRKTAKANGAVVVDRTEKNVKGITAAVFDAAQRVNTENIVVMDADFQHPPEKISEIRKKLDENDLVIAVRKKVIGHWGLVRRWESRIATALAQIRLLKSIRDPLSGFFGMKTKTFREIDKSNFELRCFKILLNILKNRKSGTKIGYVEYEFNLRLRGESKIQKKHVWYFLKNIFR